MAKTVRVGVGRRAKIEPGKREKLMAEWQGFHQSRRKIRKKKKKAHTQR